jgi:hypothetical protein
MTEHDLVGYEIVDHPAFGYTMSVYDHRQETLAFMEERGLQGGGPTWEALIQAALELSAPERLEAIEFDAEGDCVFVTSRSKPDLEFARETAIRLMSDPELRERCIAHADEGGYLE